MNKAPVCIFTGVNLCICQSRRQYRRLCKNWLSDKYA